jgi:hypothetical protein
VRGAVVRALSARTEQAAGGLSYDELESRIEGDVAYLESVLQDLTAEGMISLRDERYEL